MTLGIRLLPVWLLGAMVVTGCVGAQPSATAEPTTLAVAPTPVPVVEATPAPVCPAVPTTVGSFVDTDWTCWSGQSLTLRGWLDQAPPFGFEGPGVEPGWLPYPPPHQLFALWSDRPLRPTFECPRAAPQCTWMVLHLDPADGLSLGQAPGSIEVTGHVDDPVAPTCRWIPDPQNPEDVRPTSEAVEWCRSSFVVDAIRAAD